MRKAALIGCGDVSVVHLEAIAAMDDVELVGVCDLDAAALEPVVRNTGAPGFTAVADLLEATRPDTLHVATPHDTHVDITLEALAAGVNVIQEKPVAHNCATGQRLVDALARMRASGRSCPKVAVCLQNRYNTSSVQLRRLLSGGNLGKVRGAYATVAWSRPEGYYEDRPWRGSKARAGGGLLMNQAPHTLDLLQWLLGEVIEVSGHVSTDKFAAVSEVEDTASARLTHASGVTTCFYGTVNLSRHRPVEIELDCEHAYATIRDGLDIRWEDGRVDHYDERRPAGAGRTYWGVSHELLIRDFYARLDDPEPFWICPAEAMKCLCIAESIYESSAASAPRTLHNHNHASMKE
ncbi:Gfo/Idh/MocA family protein [Actinomyces qiguomingii]|uniref:Gfo/Idh/MocA family protein n=1 Tax=Actinomyces qiguomingii TaxID=2057800 RepID=UPI000CA05296|nr:Gfo/Idh/MocA family oxidoreductase [Actinomyces qiguomingii]